MMASRSLPWDALQFMTKNGFLSTWEDASRDEGPEHLACLGICCVDDRPDHPARQQDLVDVPDEPLEFVIGHLGPAPEVGVLVGVADSGPPSVAPDEVGPDNYPVPVVLESLSRVDAADLSEAG